MILRRAAYALALLGALLFHITNDNYLGQFLLALCMALPLLSLALSLPGMAGCRLELAAAPAELDLGEQGRWLVSIQSPNGLPLSRICVRLTGKDLLTGEQQSRKLILSGIARRRPVELAAAAPHCGVLELRVDKGRVWDYLGLISLPMAPVRPARMVCRPIPVPVEPPAVPEGSGAPSSTSAARLGPGEDFDLRPYRPGDPMRSVHWKLSSKWDELIVRERSDTLVPLPLLTLDRFGPPEALDRLLGRALGMSRALLAVQKPHAVLWLDREGQPQLHTVEDEKQLRDCLLALLSTPAPLTGPALDDVPELLGGPDGPAFRIHIALEGGNGHD